MNSVTTPIFLLFVIVSVGESFRTCPQRLRISCVATTKENLGNAVLQAKEINIYENEVLINDLDDTGNNLALETFKELSMHTESLSLQAFLEWEDIKDVKSRGFIDNEIIEIIMKEIGIKTGFISFAQFKELVEMINQVNAALEQNDLGSIDDDTDLDGDEDIGDLSSSDEESDEQLVKDHSETLQWLDTQFSKMEKK